MATKGAAVAVESFGSKSYQEYVNPQWVALLNLLDMNVEYERCSGCELFTKDERRILDFLSGYCVHNAGHNHPYIVDALKDELDKRGPAMLQSHVNLWRRLAMWWSLRIVRRGFGPRRWGWHAARQIFDKSLTHALREVATVQ
jgi:hypothetical protein